MEWLNEMSQNNRGFKPFKTDIPNRDLFNIVENYKPSKVKTRIGFFKKGYDLFDSFLDDNCTSVPKCSLEQKFTEIFYLSTKDLVSKKYKF